MSLIQNTFEGGTNGVTITTGNSGGASGTALSTVTLDSSTVAFDSSDARGTLCQRFATGVSASGPQCSWTSGVSNTTAYLRAYIRVPSNPASNINIMRFRVGTTIVGSIRLNTTGRIQQLYSSGTAGATTVATVNLGSRFRIESQIVTSTTATGSITTRLFNSEDSTTPTETITNTGISVGSAGAVTQLLWGFISSLASYEIKFDDVAFGDEGWIGPSGGTPAPAENGDFLPFF